MAAHLSGEMSAARPRLTLKFLLSGEDAPPSSDPLSASPGLSPALDLTLGGPGIVHVSITTLTGCHMVVERFHAMPTHSVNAYVEARVKKAADDGLKVMHVVLRVI